MSSLIRLFTAIKGRTDSWSSSEDCNQHTGEHWMTQNKNPLHNIGKITPLRLDGSSSEGANNHLAPGGGNIMFNDRKRGGGGKHR